MPSELAEYFNDLFRKASIDAAGKEHDIQDNGDIY